MIIVEGIDGVGKTTLVDYIVEQGLEKHHFDYDEKNMDLYKKYMRVLNSSNLNKVLDRSFISEMVYGPVIRGKSKLELEQFKRLLLEYKKSRTSIIYLTAPKEILLKREYTQREIEEKEDKKNTISELLEIGLNDSIKIQEIYEEYSRKLDEDFNIFIEKISKIEDLKSNLPEISKLLEEDKVQLKKEM